MIRKITGQDFDFIYELYMHPEMNIYLLYDPMTAEEFKDIFADLLDRGIVYIYEKDGVAAGMFKLIPLTYRTAHVAYLGGLAIDPLQSGQGLGFLMLKEILELAKETDFSRIELSVAVENTKAIRLYEKAGFTKEGVLRNYSYLKNERRYLDEALMAWLAS